MQMIQIHLRLAHQLSTIFVPVIKTSKYTQDILVVRELPDTEGGNSDNDITSDWEKHQ